MSFSRPVKAFLWSASFLFVCIMILLMLGSRWRSDEKSFSLDTCNSGTDILIKEFLIYHFGIREKVAEIFPPQSDFELQRWADQVHCKIGQSANIIFLKEKKPVWVSTLLNDTMDIGAVPVSKSARGTSKSMSRMCSDQLPKVTHQSFRFNAKDYEAWLVNDDYDHTQWGIVLSTDSILTAFFMPLAEALRDSPPYDSRVWLLQDVFALPSSINRSYKTHIRVSLNNAVLLESPNYDTTLTVKTDTLFGAVIQTHLSKEDQTYADLVAHRTLLRVIPVVIIGFILLLAFLFRYASK